MNLPGIWPSDKRAEGAILGVLVAFGPAATGTRQGSALSGRAPFLLPVQASNRAARLPGTEVSVEQTEMSCHYNCRTT